MSHTRLLAVALCLISAESALGDPLYAKNLAPLAGLVGFPNLRNAQALERNQFSLGTHLSVSNNYSTDDNAREDVNFDVETHRVVVRGAYGFGGGWEVEAEIPWMRHEGGFMDSYIENWHDFWNLPNGNRDEAPRDLIDVSYVGPGAGFALQDDEEDWGDVNLAVVKSLWQGENSAISARAGVKLATGDEDSFTGSGSEDYYLSFNASGAHRSDLPITWHAQLGYLRAGDADVLGSIQEQDLWFASGGMEWRTWQRVHLKLQVDSHRELADSSLTQLGDPSVQITAGLSWLFAHDWEAEFSFSEDIAVDTAPDFVIWFGLRFKRGAE